MKLCLLKWFDGSWKFLFDPMACPRHGVCYEFHFVLNDFHIVLHYFSRHQQRATRQASAGPHQKHRWNRLSSRQRNTRCIAWMNWNHGSSHCCTSVALHLTPRRQPGVSGWRAMVSLALRCLGRAESLTMRLDPLCCDFIRD